MKYKDKDLYVIFYSSSCGYSIRLLDFLKGKPNIGYKAYDVDKENGRFQELLKDLNDNKEILSFNPSHRTKPVVFYKGKFIGGADKTIELLSK